MKNFIAITYISFIFLCAPALASPKVDFSNIKSISTAIEVTVDQYKDIKTVYGPYFITQSRTADFFSIPLVIRITSLFQNPVILTDSKKVRLVSEIYNNELNTTYIELKDIYQGEWRMYSSAIDKDGNQIDFQKVDSKSTGKCVYKTCNKLEEARILVEIEYLENAKETGIDIKVYGQRGETEIFLPSEYIKSFLNYLNY